MATKTGIKFNIPHARVLELSDGMKDILNALEQTRPGRAQFKCFSTPDGKSLPVKRTLHWRNATKLTEKECRGVANEAILVSGNVPHKLVALGIQLCGEDHWGSDRCERCAKGKGTFEGCVKMQGNIRCANCIRDNQFDCKLPLDDRDSSAIQTAKTISNIEPPRRPDFDTSQAANAATLPLIGGKVAKEKYGQKPEFYDLTKPTFVEANDSIDKLHSDLSQSFLPVDGFKVKEWASVSEYTKSTRRYSHERLPKRGFSEIDSSNSSSPCSESVTMPVAKLARTEDSTTAVVWPTGNAAAKYDEKDQPTLEALSQLVDGIRYIVGQNRVIAEKYIISDSPGWSAGIWQINEDMLDGMLEELSDGIELMKVTST
jgi:hypothetical protein